VLWEENKKIQYAPAVVAHPEADPREAPLSERSIPHDARASEPRHMRAAPEVLVERIEAEIARIRAARPALESRLDRAGALLVTQLSCSPLLRPIRARIAADGKCRFLVRSTRAPLITYTVIPGTFECSCPDARRRGKGCKHSVACYILERATSAQQKGCSACDRGLVFLGEEIVDPESGEVVEAINPVRCGRCSGSLTLGFARRWLESQRWHYARSRPENPHSYCLRRETDDQEIFKQIVEFIREYGSPYPWWGHVYDQLPLGEWCYWTMGDIIENTILVNRKSLEQVRIDELRNTGGGGIQWRWLHGDDIEAARAELWRQESTQDELLGEG